MKSWQAALLGSGATLGALGVVGMLTSSGSASVNALAGPTEGYAGNAHRGMKDFASEGERDEPAPPPMPAAAKAAPADDQADGAMMKKRLSTLQVIKESAAGAGAAAPSAALAMPAKPMKDRAAAVQDSLGDDAPSESSLKPAPTRAWFPQSFLFDPLVVTDANGEASVDVPVPDRLTTWHVLALAHSREGSQAGAVTSFLGTLPAYVDPVVPPMLTAGDSVRLPIQLVNTLDKPLASPLKVEASGANISGGSGPVSIGAHGSTVAYAQLDAATPGSASVHVELGSTDAISRDLRIVPNGRPVAEVRGGTLAAPRTVTIAGAADMLPLGAEARLVVYPGALGLLRAELSGASERGGLDADAYALLLAGQAPALLKTLGDVPDADALRSMALLASQRVVRGARNPDVATAATLAAAALAHPDNPVLQRVGTRLAQQVAQSQRPDGTFLGGDGWTLQRLLVATASCLTAVRADAHDESAKQRSLAAAVLASGAVERNLERVEDGYTAAALVASGAARGEVADTLRAKVRKAIVQEADGARILPVPADVTRADGLAPSVAETTALAALALEGDKEAPWRADLGAALLARYRPGSGWGDGTANQVALRAVMSIFKDPVPPSIHITLERDGKAVAQGELAGERRKEALALDAEVADPAGSHVWTIRAEPPVAGLGYSLAISGYLPWKPEPPNEGLELEMKAEPKAKVGAPIAVDVSAAAPAGHWLTIRQALPAGFQADAVALEGLVTASVISAFEREPNAVVLHVPPLRPGSTFHATYPLVATLAGTLHAGASSITADDRPEQAYHLPPVTWTVE